MISAFCLFSVRHLRLRVVLEPATSSEGHQACAAGYDGDGTSDGQHVFNHGDCGIWRIQFQADLATHMVRDMGTGNGS
jgi:hypothetical protein